MERWGGESRNDWLEGGGGGCKLLLGVLTGRSSCGGVGSWARQARLWVSVGAGKYAREHVLLAALVGTGWVSAHVCAGVCERVRRSVPTSGDARILGVWWQQDGQLLEPQAGIGVGKCQAEESLSTFQRFRGEGRQEKGGSDKNLWGLGR